MEEKVASNSTKTSWMEHLNPLENEEVRENRPFYWFVLMVIWAVYAWALYSDPSLRSPWRLASITVLLSVHSVLHWVSPYLLRHQRWLLPYLVVQPLLVFAISMISINQALIIGLYMPLIGEVVGLMRTSRRIAIAVAAYVATLMANSALVIGAGLALKVLVYSIPSIFFIVLYVVMFTRQACARRKAQRLLFELQAAHRQLADYANQVEELTLSAERQRMARELHDTLAQGLAGLILQMEALEAQLGRGDVVKASLIAGQAKSRARSTLAEARRTIDDLRHGPDLSDPLPDTLRREVERFSAATGIPCDLSLPEALELAGAASEKLLRFVGEGLTNVARHAQATRVSISIGREDTSISAEIRDDGVGFDPMKVEGQAGHYGLLGLRERARLARGSMEIRSEPGNGTILRLTVPAEETANGR